MNELATVKIQFLPTRLTLMQLLLYTGAFPILRLETWLGNMTGVLRSDNGSCGATNEAWRATNNVGPLQCGKS